PTTGSIKTKGRIASLLEVGTGFHGELTGRENIFMNGAVLGMSRAEIKSKLDEIIAFSGCEKYIDTPVKRYSSGMTVRLGFAVAAHLEPEILVVDEVLAVGDAEFQKKAIGKMQDLSTGEGRTVLFVSHNMLSIKKLCSRSIVLENGKSVFEGETDKSIEFYTSQKEKTFKFNTSSRTGSADGVRITDIKIFNKNGFPIETILSGETLIAEILIDKNDYPNALEVGVGFYSADDEPQFHCSTKTINKSYYREDNVFLAVLEIKKWPLSRGTYYINAYVRDGAKLLDYVVESLWLDGEKGDYYGTGILPSWNKGFYCEYDWK
ncbi:MAG: ABC transporter ATP-binding protein, partial [Gillisia sp.]